MSADEMSLDRQRSLWNHYQENDHIFDRSRARLDHLARRAMKRSSGRRGGVLTIGVGNGYLEQQLRQADVRLTAVDLDPASLSRVAAQGVPGVDALIEGLPIRTGGVAVVVASEVLEHLDEEQGVAAVREVRRVLEPGGWFLGTVPYAEDLSFSTVACPDCRLVFHRWGHQRRFDRDSLRDQLGAQLEVRRVDVRAFADIRGRGVGGAVKGLARSALGRLGNPMASPSLVFEAAAPGA